MSTNKISEEAKSETHVVTPLESLPDYPTLVHALAEAWERAPDRTAYICQDRQVTYAQLGRAVGGLAGELQGLGAKGARVALLMGNSIEFSVGSLGTMAAGAQMAPVNPNYTDRELAEILTDADPSVIVCGRDFEEKAHRVAARLEIPHVFVLGPGGHDIAEWIDDPAIHLPEVLPDAADPAVMFFTGGTTGMPKAADHTHKMLVMFCRQVEALLGYDFDAEVMLSVAPMFHIFGHHYANVLPIYLRSPLVIVPRYKPEIVLEELEKHRVTVFSGGPFAIYVGLMGCEEFESTDLSALQYSLSGGAPCPEYLINAWEEKTGSVFLEGFGMSEGAPITNQPVHGKRKTGSVGVPPPLTEIKIVDLDSGTQVLPAGEQGEICVRGPQMTKGYRNRPEETANAVRDGWLYTGDIGYLDEDGYLFIVDRKKDMILVGGYNVYPREIDEVLHRHPAVHEAAAVGMPDEFRGEVVKAFVVLKPGQFPTEEEIIDFCAQELVDYKVPRSVEFRDELPKTGANKINRRALRAGDQ